MVKISDRFYIDADTNCYLLKEKTIIQDEKSKNYGKEAYKDLGYYSTLESCLEGMLKRLTREYIGKEEINSLSELKTLIKSQTEYIHSLNLEF